MSTPIIDHWSYSSLTLFLRNPLAFKKRYILKIYDDQMGPSGIVGQAYHKTLEAFLRGAATQTAIDAGYAHINSVPDNKIDFGKTGSRQKMIADFNKATASYFQETPDWGQRDIVGVEERITDDIEVNGIPMPLPAKCVCDAIWRGSYSNLGEGLYITDHKVVTSFTDEDEKDPRYIAQVLQAMFNYHLVLKKYKQAPKAMIFDELKISQNKNGSGQLQPRVIEFANQTQHFTFFANIYSDCTKAIMQPDYVFLPNFQDTFDGFSSFETYRNNIVGIETPIPVYKTEERKFIERQFVESSTSKPENKNLTEEEKIRVKLQEFALPVEMAETFQGPSVTMYTFRPSRGLKMSQFDRIAPDLAIALKAKSVRVQAPIYGTDKVGVEVPRENPEIVNLFGADSVRDDIGLQDGKLIIPIGVNVYGEKISKNLSDMPHLLVAGSTGSGKSVFINSAIHSLVAQNTPASMKLILIDPKRVELAQFKALPHLLTQPIYEEEQAVSALAWAVKEMEVRYKKLEAAGVRKLSEYSGMEPIVIVVDEFADLILQQDKSRPSEKLIIRLAQKARAVGIHLIIGTQRPSVDVVTGLMKANFSTRIAFMTSSSIDSTVILDQTGAEDLIGRGDMLFLDPHEKQLQRLQGYYS